MNRSQLGQAEGVRLSTHLDAIDECISHCTNSSCNGWCRRNCHDLARPPMQGGSHPAATRLGRFWRRGVRSSLKVQRQRCGGGACEEHCLGVASMEDRHAACLPSLVSLGCVQEVPLAGLKNLLDFSCIVPGKPLESIFFAARLHKSDSSFSTLHFASPLSRGHVGEVGACEFRSRQSVCVLRLSGSLRYAKDEAHERNWSFKFESGKILLGAKGETMRDTTKCTSSIPQLP